MCSIDEYYVEKILKRKIGHKLDKCGTYYLIKWLDFDKSYNTWEPEGNLSCDQILKEFIDGKVYQIEGVKRTVHGIEYWAKYADGFPNKSYTSIEARQKWPLLVIKFLEERISMKNQVRFNNTLKFDDEIEVPITESTDNLTGNPVQITYVSLLTGELMYWTEWPNGKKFVASTEAKLKWPHLVLNYLEANLNTND